MVGSFRIGAAAVLENTELGFLAPFLCWRFSEGWGSEREGVGEGFPDPAGLIELEVPAEHFSISLISDVALAGCPEYLNFLKPLPGPPSKTNFPSVLLLGQSEHVTTSVPVLSVLTC